MYCFCGQIDEEAKSQINIHITIGHLFILAIVQLNMTTSAKYYLFNLKNIQNSQIRVVGKIGHINLSLIACLLVLILLIYSIVVSYDNKIECHKSL